MMRDVAIQQKLGAAIRAEREQQGFSQEGFAARAGIDRSYFGAIERGRFNVTLDTLAKIAKGLDVPAWTLLERGEARTAGDRHA
ncbi:MAG: helix-turn-helix transcriptional regulator [Solirubrobacteraceae bacterium]|jgi:transcriptional regulator with XRE-family HTH domain